MRRVAARGGDGAAEFFGGFDPFLNDDFHVGESFLVGLFRRRASREVPHLRCSASCIPRTQRLRAGLKRDAPPALEERILTHARQQAEYRGWHSWIDLPPMSVIQSRVYLVVLANERRRRVTL